MSTTERVRTSVSGNPYIDGDFAPVDRELTAEHLEVIGQIPAALEGRYLRNGPNPIGEVDRANHHWFLGAGMVHGVRLRDSRAEWYRNRWVRGRQVTDALGERVVVGPDGDTEFCPNTNVGGFAGTTWAMVESGPAPVELSYELETVGRNNFDGTLPNGFTAHPKVDPSTGEMHALCYSWAELMDHIQYVVVGTDGRVRSTMDVPLPGMSMIHDMSLTEHYVVIYDLPVTVDLGVALSGVPTLPFRWDPGYGARVGLLPRDGSAADIVWCEVGTCYVYHPVNAYEDAAGKVVLDVCRYESMFEHDLHGPFGDGLPTLDRWTVDPITRKITEERVDDRAHEFPRVRNDRTARRHRFGYTVGLGTDLEPGPTYKYDYELGTMAVHDHGPGRGSGEASFVADPDGTSEDDGWLISFVRDRAADRSELVILDARDLSVAPLARVILPQRVPHGFHGSWVSDRAVSPG